MFNFITVNWEADCLKIFLKFEYITMFRFHFKAAVSQNLLIKATRFVKDR